MPVRQAGQIILILILVMTVALAIGIAVVQRSLSDISTSSKVEQSGRAFSAAEAGIEKAIQESIQGDNNPVASFNLDNNATVQGVDKNQIPVAGQALEYPPIAKEELAQVWLADPKANLPSCAAPYVCYGLSSFYVYFGTPDPTDKPALEVTVVSWNGTQYVPTKRFFDSVSTRVPPNGFTDVSSSCTSNQMVRTNANTTDSKFYCKVTVDGYSGTPILARIRLLYSSTSHPVAIAPRDGSFPIQARIFTSTGTAGETQRKVQVFRLDRVVPFYFDYAIFSAGDITK